MTATCVSARCASRGSHDHATAIARCAPATCCRGDPHNPSRRRKEQILRSHPDCARVVVSETALLSRAADTAGAPLPVTTTPASPRTSRARASLALERAEYRIRGARYKVPRLVREQLAGSAAFRLRADELAASLGREPDEVWREVLEYLDEMVTGFTPLFLDLMARLGKRLLRPGYGDTIDYDPEQLERLRATLATHPAVILPSHKSNFDGLVVPVALHENGLPPALTFAGINMAFWPTGSIFRRAGRIFIRRDIKDAARLPLGAAGVPRVPRREAVHARVVHRGHPFANRQARPADAGAAALHRRCLP